MKQLSILGLVLVVASAITAAVLPSKSNAKDDANFARGVFTPTSSGQNTCTGSGIACNVTVGLLYTNTTRAGEFTSATVDINNTTFPD
jgi:hypothetical protein